MPEKMSKPRFDYDNSQYWKDKKEVDGVIEKIGDYLWEVLFRLRKEPLSFDEINDFKTKLDKRLGYHRKSRYGKEERDEQRKTGMKKNLDMDLAMLEDLKVIQKKQDGKYYITPDGCEIVDYAQELIPYYINKISSPAFASLLTIMLHVILTIVKLTLGFLSMSAGILADGIDNTVDTVSSVLIWLGIKFDKEKAVSIFIIIMMFVSVGIIGYESYNKIISPEPVDHWILTFIIILICGVVMLVLSMYQYFVGKRNNNFAILCQAIDSRNHFITSILVSIGIILSFIAESQGVFWLLYADALASIIIGVLILKSAIELTIELAKSDEEEEAKITHFLGKSTQKTKERMIYRWIEKLLEDQPLTKEEICAKFEQDFCQDTPQILNLLGIGHKPEDKEDILILLEKFVEQKKLLNKNNYYEISSKHSERKNIENLAQVELSSLLKQHKTKRILCLTINIIAFSLIMTASSFITIDLVKLDYLTIFSIIIASTFLPIAAILRLVNIIKIRKIVNNLKSAIIFRLVSRDNITSFAEIQRITKMIKFEQKIIIKELISSRLLQGEITEKSIILSEKYN